MVVFIRFKDDTTETSINWLNPYELPPWAVTILDSTESDLHAGEPRNITRYFRLNSLREYVVIGDVYYVTTDSNEVYYHNYDTIPANCRAHLNREVLLKVHQQVADRGWNLGRYDIWKTNGEYSHSTSSNDTLDMVWMITRNLHDELGTAFGVYGAFIEIENDTLPKKHGSLVLDGITIPTDSMSGPWPHHWHNAGITIFGKNMYIPFDMKENGTGTTYGAIIHEMSHHHFGIGHYGNGSDSYTDYFTGIAANSSNCFGHYSGHERLRLNWYNNQYHQFNPGTDSMTVNLYNVDMSTRMDADSLHRQRLLVIPIAGETQWIMLEYRGGNDYDVRYAPGHGPHALLKPGLIAYHLIDDAADFTLTQVKAISADGNHDWSVLVDGQYANDTPFVRNRYDVIDRSGPNPYNGHHERQRITAALTGGGSRGDYHPGYWPSSPTHPVTRGPYPSATNFKDLTTPVNDGTGDIEDYFDVGDIISPYSNPPLRAWNLQTQQFDTVWIALQILSYDDNSDIYSIFITRDTSLIRSMPPARPQNLRYAGLQDSTDCPYLRWDLNREPNMDDSANYEIERSIDEGGWESLASVSHPSSDYQDSFSSLSSGIHSVRYRIRAVDNGSQASAWCEPIEIHVAVGTLTASNTPHIYTYTDLHIPDHVEVDHGMTFNSFTKISFCPNASLTIRDTMLFRQIETDENSQFVVINGTLIFDVSSQTDKLSKLGVYTNGKIVIRNGSLIRMSPDGDIDMAINAVIDAQPEIQAKFMSYSPSLGNARLWEGIYFDGTVTGAMSNLHIQDAYAAIEGSGDGVTVTNLHLFRNVVGLQSYGINPEFHDNRVDSNSYAGLVGYFLTNPIYQNRFNKNWIGAEVFMSSNTYKDNRFDSCTVIGFSSTSMNNLNFNENCDTANGNSMRRSSDGIGVVVTDQSVTNFNCDNSVRLNYVYDFQLEDSDVYGTSEFPASPNVDQDMWSIFSWACSIGYDPVLYKSGSTPGFDNAMATARSHHRNRSGFSAHNAYRNAFNLASNAREVRKSMLGILHLLRHARNGNGFSNFNTDSLSNVFSANLTSYIQDTAKAAWFRNAAKEILAFHKVGLSEYTDAADLYSELAVSTSVPSVKKPGMYRNLVAVRYGGLKNYGSAYNAYLALRNAYPNTPEVTHAKVVLKLPLTEEDLNRVRNENSESIAIPTSVIDEAEVWSMSYPNPFNPTAVIRYSLPTRSYVSLRVYSSLGKLVATLANNARDKGIHEVRFDADDLPSGVYRYELRATDEETYRTTTNYGNMFLAK